MLLIQGWLIGDSKQAKRERIANIIYCCLLIGMVFLSIFGALD
jgi:hypothetical protein